MALLKINEALAVEIARAHKEVLSFLAEIALKSEMGDRDRERIIDLIRVRAELAGWNGLEALLRGATTLEVRPFHEVFLSLLPRARRNQLPWLLRLIKAVEIPLGEIKILADKLQEWIGQTHWCGGDDSLPCELRGRLLATEAVPVGMLTEASGGPPCRLLA